MNKTWSVNLKKVDNNVILEKGWNKFVEDNCLEFGDFLIFSYDGSSKFHVRLYGKNGCKKEISPTKEQHKGKRRNSNEKLTHGNESIDEKHEGSRVNHTESGCMVNESDKPTLKRKRRTLGARLVREDQNASRFIS